MESSPFPLSRPSDSIKISISLFISFDSSIEAVPSAKPLIPISPEVIICVSHVAIDRPPGATLSTIVEPTNIPSTQHRTSTVFAIPLPSFRMYNLSCTTSPSSTVSTTILPFQISKFSIVKSGWAVTIISKSCTSVYVPSLTVISTMWVPGSTGVKIKSPEESTFAHDLEVEIDNSEESESLISISITLLSPRLI